MSEGQVLFCREIIMNAKLGSISAGNLTTTILEHCISQKLFKELYELHCNSDMANHLAGGSHKNTVWDYEFTNIANCPYVRQLFRWLRTFVSFLYQVSTIVIDLI